MFRIRTKYLPKQFRVLQICILRETPEHVFPLYAGDGEEHVLDLYCVPWPHVIEQLPQELHWFQPQLTK